MIDWHPLYRKEVKKRIGRIERFKRDPESLKQLFKYYKKNPVAWIEDWCVTYDPRTTSPQPKIMPFILFPKQKEFVQFLLDCINNKESGLVEKARDMGATWLCVAFTVWLWLFDNGSSIGWGSRKEQLIDKIGDPDSIFQKIRIILQHLPNFMLPAGFDMRMNASYMKIINPATGASITGEAGDNIGRGGRKKIYFKDESAHYERPELIEAALGDNTDVQIDISSVNGAANVFYRRRMAGIEWQAGIELPKGRTRIFVFDWRDHPLKTQEWYDLRRARAETEGLLHIFAQEVDRDYTSALVGVVIPNKWIKAAIDAHVKLGIKPDGAKRAGQDVADGGNDKNALAIAHGVILQYAEEWAGEAGEAAKRTLPKCAEFEVKELSYDSIGVGAGFKAGANQLAANYPHIRVRPWAGSESPINPTKNIIPHDRQSPTNEDFFANLKAQAWWNLRTRFEKTYKVITQGASYPHDELISLPSTLPNLHKLELQLSQATMDTSGKGKLIIDKSPNGASSPNIADAMAICYTPNRSVSILDVL